MVVVSDVLTSIERNASYIEEGSFNIDKLNFGRRFDIEGKVSVGWFRGDKLHGYGKDFKEEQEGLFEGGRFREVNEQGSIE